MRRLLVVLAGFTAACSLLVDTSGLSGGDDGTDGGRSEGGDATTPPGVPPPPPPGVDASGDDAGDAGTDGRVSTYRATVLADSPGAYLRLGDAPGTSAPKNEVTGAIGAAVVYGGAPVLGVPGAIAFDSDTAVRFDEGSSARVDFGNVIAKAGSGTTSISIELWFQPLQPLTDSPRFLFDRDVNGGNGQRYDFFAYNEKLELERHDSDGGIDGVYDDTANLVLGNWYHVVVVFAPGALSNGLKIYVNGTLGAAADEAITLGDAPGSLYFGSKVGGPSVNSANGALDEIAIYTKVLTPAQILAHYNAGIGN